MGIKKALAVTIYMAAVYHALSSHDEKPVMLSRPSGDKEEVEQWAADFKKLEGYKVHIWNVRSVQGLDKLFESFNLPKREGPEI